MCEYVSLGSDCSIAFQLKRYNLRNVAYPFDNVKTRNIKLLISTLSERFCNYTKFTSIGTKNCYQHVSDENTVTDISSTDTTIVLKNQNGIIFPHDYSDDVEIDTVIEKYQRRIDRFLQLENIRKSVVFLWYEQNKVINTEISNLESVLLQLFPNLQWNLIVICKKVCTLVSPRVYFVQDTSEFIDWSKNNLDWPSIFGMRTKITMNYGQECSPIIHPQVANYFRNIQRNASIVYSEDHIYCDDEEYSLNGYRTPVKNFVQSNTRVHNHIDRLISEYLVRNTNYIGIYGLAPYYAYRNKDKFETLSCYDKSSLNIDTGNANDISTYHYNELNFSSIDCNTTILVNYRKVEKHLSVGINESKAEFVIYIKCAKESLHCILQDYLSNFRIINNVTVVGIDTNVTILYFARK